MNKQYVIRSKYYLGAELSCIIMIIGFHCSDKSTLNIYFIRLFIILRLIDNQLNRLRSIVHFVISDFWKY